MARIWWTRFWVPVDSGAWTGATEISDMPGPAGWAGATADTSGRVLMCAARALTAGEFAGAPTTMSIGAPRLGGNWVLSASFTWRAVAPVGSTLASTVVNLTWVKNGMPSAISTEALVTAISAGRRMTN